jgi:hypothetical protein
LVSPWVVHVGDGAVVRFGEGAAREDVCGGEARGFFDTVQKKDLVRRRDEEDAEDGQPMVLGTLARGGGLAAYLALGRGTAGVFAAFLDGWWSAGVDMLRFFNSNNPVAGRSIAFT